MKKKNLIKLQIVKNIFKLKYLGYFDKFFKRETGISLLEKYGFLKALKKNNSKNTITEF